MEQDLELLEKVKHIEKTVKNIDNKLDRLIEGQEEIKKNLNFTLKMINRILDKFEINNEHMDNIQTKFSVLDKIVSAIDNAIIENISDFKLMDYEIKKYQDSWNN